MANMNLKKQEMPHLDPNIRRHTFDEVATGYTDEMAIEEAKRCLNCKTRPCVEGCPVEIDIPEFITEIAKGSFKKGYEILSQQTALPAICGRVCPQESQCEGKCVRAIKGESVAIGRLERFLADWAMDNTEKTAIDIKKNNIKIAIVGAGPTGLTAAGELAKLGYDVTIYEALHIPGGVLIYGIPEFRLPKRIVENEIEGLKALGVNIRTNVVIGKTLTVDELFLEGYRAVYIGSGAGLPRFMNIKGEMLKGVYSANEYLTRVNLMKAYLKDSKTPIRKSKNVAVVGGGNVAMDAARSAKRLGAENVYIIYRRGMEELPARQEEVDHAIQEGIVFKVLSNPTQILGDEKGEVIGLKSAQMTLGEADESGRRSPIVKENSEFILDVDTVIMSIGTSPNPLISSTTYGLQTDKYGCLITNGDDGLTTKTAVYAGGDAVTGAATVILAMGAGKKSARAIDKYLKENS